MTHTNTTRELENFGSLHAEILEIDISSLDAEGTENSVAPTHLDTVEGFTAHLVDAQGTGEFAFPGWNASSDTLYVHNGTSAGMANNNAAVNDTKVTWWGRR